jgi:hypothetical protein
MHHRSQSSVLAWVLAGLLAFVQFAPAHAMGRSGSYGKPQQLQGLPTPSSSGQVESPAREQALNGQVETLRKELVELKVEVAMLKVRPLER